MFNYQEAYKELNEIFFNEGVYNALKFAFKNNPDNTTEWKQVRRAFHVCEGALRICLENNVK